MDTRPALRKKLNWFHRMLERGLGDRYWHWRNIDPYPPSDDELNAYPVNYEGPLPPQKVNDDARCLAGRQ